MKVEIITSANKKGQIVIPKQFRDELGINSNVYLNLVLKDNGIFIQPIKEVMINAEREENYVQILNKTKGAWKNLIPEKNKTQRKKIELKASKIRKKQW
jgi:AbrB family looped-hinge helix DNA binding protein